MNKLRATGEAVSFLGLPIAVLGLIALVAGFSHLVTPDGALVSEGAPVLNDSGKIASLVTFLSGVGMVTGGRMLAQKYSR